MSPQTAEGTSAKVNTREASPQNAVLSDPAYSEEDGPWTIHGVALKDGELTHGQNGAKLWPGEELQKAAPSLAGSTVTTREGINGIEVSGALEETNHGDRVSVGEITRSAYDPDRDVVVYDMRVENEDVAAALALGDLEISIEASNPGEVDEDPHTGATIMRDYEFSGMDVVNKGAARSNHTAAGSAADNPAIAALSAKDVEHVLDENDATEAEDAESEISDSGGGRNENAALESGVHDPTYSGTTESAASFADGNWGRPSMGDFDTDDLSEIGSHFIASTSGFPADEYGDLKLPVVEPGGNLNLNGLRAANSRVSSTSGLSDGNRSSAETKIQNLAESEFDEEWGNDEEAANEANGALADSDEDTGGEETNSDTHTDVKTTDEETSELDDEEAEVDAEAESEREDAETDEVEDPDGEESSDPSSGDDGGISDDPETPASTEDTSAESEEEPPEADVEAETQPDQGEESDTNTDADTDSGSAESTSTMSNEDPTSEEENGQENEEETPENEVEDLDLDGKVVIDEERHDELKAKADYAAALESELDETVDELEVRENQIDTVHDVYAAALADIGPHTEEFYKQNKLEVLIDELQAATGAENEQAALEENVTSEQPLPQTGEQANENPEGEAALEEANNNAEAALRLDDRAELARSEMSPREFVESKYEEDPSEYDNDVELRDTIYGGEVGVNGGVN